MARRIHTNGTIDMVDDEIGSDEMCSYSISRDTVVTPDQPGQISIDTCCGGEVRTTVELTMTLLNNGETQVQGNVRLFEGISCGTTDQEASVIINRLLPNNQTVRSFHRLENTGGGSDSADILLDFTSVKIPTPVLVNNRLTIAEGETLRLISTDLRATIDGVADPALEFTVDNVQHGRFERVAVPGITITSFTQAQIFNQEIQFVHDGGEESPSYFVQVSDGRFMSVSEAAIISFIPVNDAPEVAHRISDQEFSLKKDFELSIKGTFRDADNDSLSLTVNTITNSGDRPLPPDIIFDPQTAILSGVLREAGTLPLRAGARDPSGASVNTTFNLSGIQPVKNTETSNLEKGLIGGSVALGFLIFAFTGVGLLAFCHNRKKAGVKTETHTFETELTELPVHDSMLPLNSTSAPPTIWNQSYPTNLPPENPEFYEEQAQAPQFS